MKTAKLPFGTLIRLLLGLTELQDNSTSLVWAKLLMGRRLCTDVSQLKKQLVPCWPHVMNFRRLDQKFKASQKYNYDDRHRVRELLPCRTNYLFGLTVKENKFLVRSPTKLPLPDRTWSRLPLVKSAANRSHLRVRTKNTAQFKSIRRLHRTYKHYTNTFLNWHWDPYS